VLLCVLGLISGAAAPTAQAEPSVGDVMKVFNERIAIEPKLENYGSDGSTIQGELDKALESLESMNQEYNQGAVDEIVKNYGLNVGSDGATIDTEISALNASMAGASEYGSTAYLVGGEAVDAAASTFGLSALGAASLLPWAAAGAGAFTAGYLIGEILYERWTGGEDGNATHAELGGGSYVPEAVKWLKIFVCERCTPNPESTFSEYHPDYEALGSEPKPFHIITGTMPNYPSWVHGGSTHAYLMVFKVAGSWYFAGNAFQTTPKSEVAVWVSGTIDNTESGTCHNYLLPGELLGWPPGIKNMTLADTTVGAFMGWRCPYEGESLGPRIEPHVVYVLRKPSQMPMNFPRKAPCPEGHSCTTVTRKALPSKASDLAKKAHEELPGGANDHKTFEEFQEHTIMPSKPALPGLGEVPSCFLLAMTGTECVALVKAAGFTNTELVTTEWEHAVITRSPHEVITVSPGGGSKVETSKKVVVTQNPDEEHMPVAIPPPLPNETGPNYKKRVEELSLPKGAKWTKVAAPINLPKESTDPLKGPDALDYTRPGEGSRANPDGSTPVQPYDNPLDAPQPAEPGGGPSGPTIPAIKFLEVPTPCNKFPFGVPCWLAQRMIEMATSTKAPKFSIPLEGHVMKVNFDEADKEMEIVRAVEAVLGTIGVILMFGAFASSSAGSSGAGGDD
jgi:hypothetical protein